MDRHDPEADVVVTPLRLEPLPECRTGSPGVVGPRAAPARAGTGAVPVRRCRGFPVVEIRVRTAGQSGVIPVPAPLDNVTVHVVDAPGVGRVAADLAGPIQGRPFFGAVVGPVLDVRLLAAELVAE